MARKLSVLFIVFGILNILAAFGPPCAGCVGVSLVMKRGEGMMVNGRDIGPQFWQHVDREAPTAKFEAWGAVSCNWFIALLLIAGAIGLFVGHEWGRWLSVGAAVLMILTLCIHDIYQFAVVRPVMTAALDRVLPIPPGPEREGFKIGFTGSMLLWLWINPFLMVYLAAMAITLSLNALLGRSANEGDSRRRRRRDRDRDDLDRDDRDDD